MPLPFKEKVKWAVRLLIFPKMRVSIHLPVVAGTRAGDWVEFPRALHDLTIVEIEQYLQDRFTGVTSEIFIRQRSEGIWRGLREKNLVIFTDGQLAGTRCCVVFRNARYDVEESLRPGP